MTHDQLLAFLHTIGCEVTLDPYTAGEARYCATDRQTPSYYPQYVFYVYWDQPGIYTVVYQCHGEDLDSHRPFEEINDPAEIAKTAQQRVGDYLLEQEKP